MNNCTDNPKSRGLLSKLGCLILGHDYKILDACDLEDLCFSKIKCEKCQLLQIDHGNGYTYPWDEEAEDFMERMKCLKDKIIKQKEVSRRIRTECDEAFEDMKKALSEPPGANLRKE